MAGYDKRRFMINAIYDEDAKRYKDSTLSSHALFQKYRKMEQGCETSLSDRVEGGKLESASSSKAELDHAAVKEEEKVSAPPLIGRSFAETFAYLKNTDHYKEATESVQTSAQSKRSNCIVVNSRQRGNPILKHVRNVPWEYGEIIPDYEIGLTSCALFLSLRYHNLNPEYIHERLKQLGSRYILRVLLVMVDVNDSRHSLNELGKIAIRTDCTLLLAWSAEEAGRYLETYKSFENKPPDVLQEKVESDYLSKMQDCLTSIKSVNKSDVITLISTFGSLDKLVVASKDEIALCPGIGPLKAERLMKAFYEPFKRHRKASTDPKKAVTSPSDDSGGSEGFESKPESEP